MRLALGWVLLAGCATVEHSTVVAQTRGREECGKGDFVASVFPGDWPNVIVEVLEQRSCSTPIEETYEVRRELRVSSELANGIGAGLGAAAGIGALIALQSYSSSRGQSYSYNQGDGWLLLPLAGAVAGSMLIQSLNVARQVQPLSTEVRVATSYQRRDEERTARAGLLSHGATPLAELRDGRARLPLELAMGIYGRPLKLDGRVVDWSVRATAWVPGRLPACARAAEVNQAASLAGSFRAFSASQLARAETDAEACVKDGWPFAQTMLMRIGDECRERYQRSCQNVP